MTTYVNPSTRIGGVKQIVVPDRVTTVPVDEAPFDDVEYVRVNGEWVAAPKIQMGTEIFPAQTIAAGAAVFQTVTYPSAIGITNVTVSLGNAPGGTEFLVPRVLPISSTTFRIYIYNVHGTVAATFASDLVVYWQSIT